MKLVQRGRCSAEVLCPAESLPVTYPSHHPSMVMSTPPAKTVNTELLVTHDFAIASILKKCFLKTSHSRLLTDEIVQRNTEPPLGQYAKKKKKAKEKRKKPIHEVLHGPDPPYCHQAVQDLSNSSFLLLAHQGENGKPEHSKGRDC